MTRFPFYAALLAIVASVSAAPRPAQAAQSYDNCTGFITSLPATIGTQGTWCLNKDLTTAITGGNAILINANNVTIDCNDFKIDGLAAGTATDAYGIYALNRLNASVRHCNIRGFISGLYLDGVNGGGHAVEDNVFDRNTLNALQIFGDGSVIRRNRIYNTGGTTNNPTNTNAIPIDAVGSIDVIDNLVSGVNPTSGDNGYAYGMYIYGDNGGRIIGNRIRGLKKDGTAEDLGIVFNTGTDIIVRDNDLVGDASAGSLGVQCAATDVDLRGNMISGFVNPKSGCVDNGNDIVP